MKKSKRCLHLIALFTVILSSSSYSQSILKDSIVLQESFKNPPLSAHPKVYWWVLNGNLDTTTAKQELLAMKNAGIGGFDFFEIGVPERDTMIAGGPAFLSDESLRLIKFAVKEAERLGLEMGLNLASSWNAGGAWTKPENAAKSIYSSKIKIEGGSFREIKIPFPEISFPEASIIGGSGKPMIPLQANGRPEYYEEIAILAVPANAARKDLDTTKIINVSKFFDPATELLKWKAPAGEWEIQRYVSSNSGQEVVLPSPHSAGLTIDHFDSTAVRTHLMYIINRLKPLLGDFRETALKSFYLASYEARGAVWTSTLPSEFKKINGYDIYKFLPSLFESEIFDKETTQTFQRDFKKTLSELFINNLYKQAKKICNQYGLKINSEAGGPGYPLYNAPAEPLKALGSLDIPRGEFWVNHSRYYMDSNGIDSIDVLRVTKEVAAASNIYQRKIAEQEAFTSFQHWQEGPFDLKPIGDRAFGEGMNRVVFHGFSHNPAGSGFPGYVYHAGTHYNTKRIWWPKIKPFNEYLSRISHIAQEASFVSDVLWYYGDKIPNAGTPKNTHFVVGPGYDYEIVNTEILLKDLAVKNGKLVLSNGAEFSILVLEQEEIINPAVLRKLNDLAKNGAVIVGSRPKKIAAEKNNVILAEEGVRLINQLWMEVKDTSKFKIDKKGSIYSEIAPIDMLRALGVPPDIDYSDKESWLIDFIHYKKDDLDFYFISNTSDRWISREVGFRQNSKIPEIWNPLTGKIVPISIFNQEGKYIKIPITLAPHGSYFVVFRNGQEDSHYSGIRPANENPPLMEFTENGLQILEEGKFNLIGTEGSHLIENDIQVIDIEGPWEVSFPKDWGAPNTASFPKLISWTETDDKGIMYFSGTATYEKTFRYEKDPTAIENHHRLYLDLGEISEVAEVWLNDQRVGISWAKPYRFDVTEAISDGQNTLRIEVANTWSNRIVGDALTGESYTNSNIKISSRGINWRDTPLIKAGLLGPVTLKLIKIIYK